MATPAANPAPDASQHETMPLIVPLNASAAIASSLVGSKAANLSRLVAAGLPVPQGFCVTAAAYRAFAGGCPQIADDLAALSALSSTQVDDALGIGARLRARLLATPIPPEVEQAVASAYESLDPATACAVRSSATVEDLKDASFAGLYDSFLGVCDRAALLERIRGCWASLFTDRAISYRRRLGLDERTAAMAVLVQAMVPAQAAGVMFTADPQSGRTDRIFIEAARGLGEAVVSGRVTPDRMTLSAEPLRVIETQVGAITPIQACEPALTERTALRLGELGLRAQGLLKQPLDIEWAVADDQLWLLQARPITTRPRATTWEERQVWTNANIAEVLPEVLSPITWSILELALHEVFNDVFQGLCADLRTEEVVTRVAGRAYLNHNTLTALLRRVPVLKHSSLGEMLGGHQETWAQLQRIELGEEDIPDVRLSWWRTVRYALPALIGVASYRPRQMTRLRARMQHLNEELQASVGPAPSVDALVRGCLVAADFIALGGRRRVRRTLGLVGAGLLHVMLLFRLCERWLGDDGRATAARLLAGMGDVHSADAGLDLWRLAEAAHALPAVRAVLLEGQSFAAVRERLMGVPDGPAFLHRWQTYLNRHGHHVHNECELMMPRWAEQPDYVLSNLRDYLRALASGQPGPIPRWQAVRRERQALAQACCRRLRFWQRPVFRLVLHRAQHGSRERENLKNAAVQRGAIARRFLLQLGDQLVAQGGLPTRDDVFFLKMGELHDLTQPDQWPVLRERIALRRVEYDYHRTLTPPAVVIGRFDPTRHRAATETPTGDTLHGLGASAGAATGPARVIIRPGSERLLPGEILVAPFTDPGWTPCFLNAIGIVMDLGGMLSHGSVIAREYGIPAVVNVGTATRRIRTGQRVHVDGTRGIVTILADSDGKPPT